MAFLGSVTSSLGLGSGTNLAAFCIFSMAYTVTVTRIWVRQQARQGMHTFKPVAANDDHVGRSPKVQRIRNDSAAQAE
jgi:UDP-GlcNAc:undecaprenyl-phosphate GlcNAc-1-phosphate transferase